VSNLKKYDITGKEKGEVKLNPSWLNFELNHQVVKDCVVAIRANARQWSANTRGRSEVNHSTQKPHAQKKTGKARQGRLSSPQYKGGGVVFGPKPKFDQHVRINKKERQAASHYMLAQKVKHNKVVVLEDHNPESPKTKTYAELIKKLELKGSVLFIMPGSYEELKTDSASVKISVKNSTFNNAILSIRNLEKVQSARAPQLNVYEIMKYRNLVISESALSELMEVE
jgi:large subunit ribosomal protein L4